MRHANIQVLIALSEDLLDADDCDQIIHIDCEMQDLMNCFSKECSTFVFTICVKNDCHHSIRQNVRGTYHVWPVSSGR